MKTILGIGNALTDILAVLPDDTLLNTFHLPKGSMQHVDMETGDKIWATLKPLGVKYVAGGSAAKQMLLEPYAKVVDVAHRLGYEDLNYFCRLFKKKNDCTPTEYKQKHA